MELFRELMRSIARKLKTHQKVYAWGGVAVLLPSAGYWALLGARLEQGNADQLAGGFLFENAHTFAHALFPAAHTQLLKWPVFWLLGLAHNANWAYEAWTILLVLATVGSLAFLLFKIIRQPLLFGVVCLGLACVLLLVPAQVFGGVSAPLNMALITGRNVEYLLYVGALVLFVKSRMCKTWQWLFAVVLLALLMASDQLFVPLSLGGSLLVLAIASLWQHGQLLAVARQWLFGSVAAWVVAKLVLWMLASHVTGIVGNDSPYGHIQNWHNLWLAIPYALKALLLNFGVTTRAGWFTGFPAFCNAVFMVGALFAAGAVVRRVKRQAGEDSTTAALLTILLLGTTLTAFIVYIVTDHTYAADARYVTISLFAGFVALATWVRQIKVAPKMLLLAGGVAFAGVVMGLVGVYGNARNAAVSTVLQQRNQRIAQALRTHPAEILMGSYWRVLPVKVLTKQSAQRIIPLRSCTQPTVSLRSTVWQQDVRRHKFAYLLSLRPSGVPSATCTLQMIEFKYGHPTGAIVIAGSQKNPTELLLFYDNGADNTGH